MKSLYDTAAERSAMLGDFDMAEAAPASCMNDVGVEHEGHYFKWDFGLQSGWRHTMLLHYVSNLSLGHLVADIVAQLVPLAKLLISAHQGDDSGSYIIHRVGTNIDTQAHTVVLIDTIVRESFEKCFQFSFRNLS